MGFLSDLFGGGGGDTQTTTTQPWAGLQPYLNGADGIMPAAQQLYQGGPQQYYGGNTFAGFDPLQDQSQKMGINYAQSGLNGMLDPTMASYKNVVSGGLMSPDSNPYMQQNINAMASSVKDNMALSGISGNEDAAQFSGQYGSARHGLADYLTRKNANEVIGRNTNEMLMGGYNSGLNAMMGGLSMAPQMGELGMAPSNLMNTIGRERQGMAQSGITDNFNRYMFNQQSPWQNLQNYAGVLGGNFMGSGGSTTSPVTGGSPLGSALGGGLSGFAASGGNPWGAGIGALGGLLSNR